MMVMQPSSAPMYTPPSFQPSYAPRYTQSDMQQHTDNANGKEDHSHASSSNAPQQQLQDQQQQQPQQQQRPREVRPDSPAAIAPSNEEDSGESYDLMMSATPEDIEEDEEEVDPAFHSRSTWRGSASMDDIQSKATATRPEFSRCYTEDSAYTRMVRPRSHFSIPDVVVTSCEEEGEEEYFEMKVEPTRRKMSLPTLLKQLEGEQQQHPASEEISAAALPPAQMASAVKEARPKLTKSGTGIFKTKSKPAPISVVQDRSHTVEMAMEMERQKRSPEEASSTVRTFSAASTSLPERSTFAKKMRKSSLSNLFGRREKDATPPPPSPTVPLEWQATAGSLLEERLKQQQQQGPEHGGVSPPPLQSPTAYSLMESPLPSPTTPTSPSKMSEQSIKRSPTKKELKAKEKQEKALMKEREKVDKMVRKHDKKVQKALLKKASKESTTSANRSDKDSVSASSSASASTSSSIQKMATGKERSAKKTAADRKAMKAADFCARHVSPPVPFMTHEELMGRSGSPTDSHRDPYSAGRASISSPKSAHREQHTVGGQNAAKRRSRGSFRGSTGIVTSAQRISFERATLERRRRETPSPTSQIQAAIDEEAREGEDGEEEEETGKENVAQGESAGERREDDGAAAFKLTLNLTEAQAKQGSPTTSASEHFGGDKKRMTLLESLYKDIEEMEMRFEHGHSSGGSRVGGGATSPPQLPPLQSNARSSNRATPTTPPPREAKHPARARSPLERERHVASPIYI